MYCGRATTAKLNNMAIRTIGDIARAGPEIMEHKFGKNGVALWTYASGNDTSRVAHQDFVMPAKSVGHGITCVADLENMEEVRMVIIALSQDIGHRLRVYKLKAKGVQVYIRDSRLCSYLTQTQLDYPTQSEALVSRAAIALVEKSYAWNNQIRAITISAINLIGERVPTQTTIFCDCQKRNDSRNWNTRWTPSKADSVNAPSFPQSFWGSARCRRIRTERSSCRG